jgi:hypothetical protein
MTRYPTRPNLICPKTRNDPTLDDLIPDLTPPDTTRNPKRYSIWLDLIWPDSKIFIIMVRAWMNYENIIFRLQLTLLETRMWPSWVPRRGVNGSDNIWFYLWSDLKNNKNYLFCIRIRRYLYPKFFYRCWYDKTLTYPYPTV